MSLNKIQKIFLYFFLLISIFWLVLYTKHITEGFYNYLYSFLFGLIPLVGGFVAVRQAKLWGGLKSAVGKAVFYIGLGVFLWGCGETIWSYYNFVLNVPAPYPSLADLGFAPSIFFYGLGTVYLSKATGAKYGLQSIYAKLFVLLASIMVAFLSYHFLITVARGGILLPEGETFLKGVLDVAYPLGDFIALMLGVIISGLSFKYLGGKYKLDILAIFAGLWVMFIADAIFSYTTTIGTYYNADFGDLMLSTGTFFLTFGILGFTKLRESHPS